jgi:DNA-binding transcriptional MerR regulator
VTEDLLTLAELAERSGVEIRTLRSWMAQGVIPGPESVGRNARYPAAALSRARAVRAMRDLYGMSLSQIRQDLLTADAARIEAYAAMAGAGGAKDAPVEASALAPSADRAPSGTSAAEYLRSLRGAGVFGAAPTTPAAPAPPPSFAASAQRIRQPVSTEALASGSRLARLAEALERLAGVRPARRKAKGEVRLHIPITPDLELAVRGDHAPEEIARFEQIADLLRTLITGGTDHD